MKKIILSLILIFSTLYINAQSIELHQSYNDGKSAWGSTRLISEYFYTSDDSSFNVFSWNSFSQNGISGLAYVEYLLSNDIYLHGEVRAQFGNFEYSTITPEIGLAYLLPISCECLTVYLTPKYVYNDVYLSKHDFQFSVNSGYENDYVYYEGYLDTNWAKGFNAFTEQKAYYKLTNSVQVGGCVVFNAGKNLFGEFNSHIQPYVSVRFGLY